MKIPKQQTYDTVLAHLLAQGKRASTDSGCKYRTSDGLKCAAGCLIPDEQYQPAMEGCLIRSYGHLTRGPASDCLARLGHDLPLVADLQWLHDKFFGVGNNERFWTQAHEIAVAHGLTPYPRR
jgi:hypothetical protein